MALRHGLPAVLSLLALATLAGCLAGWIDSGGGVVMVVFATYVVTTDWLLLALRNAPVPRRRGGHWFLVGLRLAIGAPTAGFLIYALGMAIGQGDLAWDGPFFALVPVLLIWPLIILTLKGIEDPA